MPFNSCLGLKNWFWVRFPLLAGFVLFNLHSLCLCVFGNHVFKRENCKESLSARLSLRLASTPPYLPQQSDRNHLQDALVLRLRTRFDHENTPTATAAQLTLPSTNHLNTFTRTNEVLHVTSTSENAPWCNMFTVQSLIELQDKGQSSTTEHAYTQGPFNAAIPLCKVTKRLQKNKARECTSTWVTWTQFNWAKKSHDLKNTKAWE